MKLEAVDVWGFQRKTGSNQNPEAPIYPFLDIKKIILTKKSRSHGHIKNFMCGKIFLMFAIETLITFQALYPKCDHTQ